MSNKSRGCIPGVWRVRFKSKTMHHSPHVPGGLPGVSPGSTPGKSNDKCISTPLISCGLLWAIFKNVITIYSQRRTLNSNFCNVCHNYPFLSYKSSLTTPPIWLPCRVVSVLIGHNIHSNFRSKQFTPSSIAFSFKPRKLSTWRLKFLKLFKSSLKEILKRKRSKTCEFRKKVMTAL